MAESIDSTLDERGSRYGDFSDNAKVYQALQLLRDNSPSGSAMTPVQINALDQMFVKLSRIFTGDPSYRDNWVDIAGYATLVVAECDGVKR